MGQYEYINQNVKHQFNLTNEPTQKITLAHATSTMGGGLQGDLWLGDLWVLSTSVAYQYGTESPWKVSRPDQFLNRSWEKGTLTSPQTGESIKASFSGILVELGFKLNFYSF